MRFDGRMSTASKSTPDVTARRVRRGGKKAAGVQPRTPVIGLEAEFSVYVKEEKCLPERIFRSPQKIVREKMIPRTGRSFHLPSGGALYFDTGVIEVATPIIEIEVLGLNETNSSPGPRYRMTLLIASPPPQAAILSKNCGR